MALPSNIMVEKNIADIPALADNLEKLVTHSGTKLTDTAVAVSGSSVITKEIELPAGLSDLQMEMQIEVEADQYIPYPMEEVSSRLKKLMVPKKCQCWAIYRFWVSFSEMTCEILKNVKYSSL